MLLVDVHSHMDFPEFEKDLDEVLERNQQAGIKAIIVNGVDPTSNRRVLDICKTHPILKPAFGYYPTHIIEADGTALDEELSWIERQHPIALGEVGLDYKHSDENQWGDEKKKEMQEGFQKIIALAEKKKIPLIVHSRQAEADVVDMLESAKTKKIVMHCFMGRKALLKRIIDNGWYTSIPCIIGRAQQFQDMARLQDMAHILTETDAPYLSPFKDIPRNEPAFILETIKKIAEIKKLDEEEVANNVWKNYQQLFL
jgi:TatD DNase family protein